MPDIITIGKRLVPLEQIAYVESFDPSRNPEFKPEKEFKARVVLLNRDMLLAEAAPRDFADAHGLRFLDTDTIAVNPAVSFRVETFAATDRFKPEKSYLTRLKWRDAGGHEQSKLLLADPETVIAAVLRRNLNSSVPCKGSFRRPSTRRPARRTAAKSESAGP